MRGRHDPQVTMLALVGSAGFEPANCSMGGPHVVRRELVGYLPAEL